MMIVSSSAQGKAIFLINRQSLSARVLIRDDGSLVTHIFQEIQEYLSLPPKIQKNNNAART
jgi:hypothetical protein